MATFSIPLRSLTSTFICRQANASYGAPFPKEAGSEQRNLATLIFARRPLLLSFHISSPFSLNSLGESELAQDQAGTGNRRAQEWSDTDCASSN